ncbi:MAG: HAD hydrolase-like protein [Lachnospiraceae bacterium]
MSKRYILFDLDGTLTDPKEGICTCVQKALAAQGIIEDDLDKLEPFIGPPLLNSFMEFYGLSEEKAKEAIVTYRERFSTVGKFENIVYLGIPELLRTLKSAGFQLAVASSKPEVYVNDILEYFQIKEYFDVITGSELDGTRVDKDEVIAEALNRLFHYKAYKKDQVIMVGDRKFDVLGAKEIGIENIAVTYGYGSEKELEQAEADHIVHTVEELGELLLSMKSETVQIPVQKDEKSNNTKTHTLSGEPQKGIVKSGVLRHNKRPMDIIWMIAYPMLLYFIITSMAQQVLSLAVTFLAESNEAIESFMFSSMIPEEGVWEFTADGSGVISIVAVVITALLLLKIAEGKKFIVQAEHKDKYFKTTKNLIYIGFSIVLAIGLNFLMVGSGLTAVSESYSEVVISQYAVSIPIGICLYGIGSAIVEEILLRGIVFNKLQIIMKPLHAAVFTGLIFGMFHGNIVQGMYAFAFGTLFSVAYYLSGSFLLPVLMHGATNIAIYLMSTLGVFKFGNLQMCIGMVITMISIYAIYRKKDQFFVDLKVKEPV